MKTVTVSIDGRAVSQVRLNNAVDEDALTARMATEARNIAAGVAAYATVTDGATTYRVTSSGARKVTAEE